MRLLLLVAMLAGCVTRPIADHAVAVPEGLTLAEVELGLERAILGMPRAAHPFGPAGRDWSAEHRAPGYFEAVMRRNPSLGGRNPYMTLRVAVQYSEDEVWTRIIGGTNVRFDGSRVHKTALEWERRLGARFETELRLVAEERRRAR